MTLAIYNENEPYAARWLKNLSAAGHIATGAVIDRDIRELVAADVQAATQAHFFAGIGVWSYALRLAGWPDDRPIWTGSCPCQPFSGAGRGKGIGDPRHLWPVWLPLIRECRPGIIVGEQVSSRGGLGWWDVVRADLESEGYVCAAIDICAAGVGAPHMRQRLYWVAYAGRAGRWTGSRPNPNGAHGFPERGATDSGSGSDGVDQPEGERYRSNGLEPLAGRGQRAIGSAGQPHARRLGHTEGKPRGLSASQWPEPPDLVRTSEDRWARATNGFWANSDWLFCTDGRWRPVEPGTFPLAHGVAGRVGRLRAYGNAIVAPQAATFIKAVMEILDAQVSS